MAGLLGRDRLLMAFERPPVLILPADAITAGDLLRGLAEANGPVLLELGVDHPPPERGVIHGLAAARELSLGLFQDVGSAGHALDAPGEKAGAVPGLNFPGGRHHRLHAGAAQPVNGGRRNLDRQPGQQHRHPRHVAVVLARLVGVAEIDVLDGRGIQLVALHRLADDQRREVVGPDLFQGAGIAADRCAQRIDDDRPFHGGHATSLKCARAMSDLARQRVPTTQAAPAAPARVQRRRRSLLRTYLTPKQAIPRPTVITLGIGSFVVILAVWSLASILIYDPQHLFAPSPRRVLTAWVDMIQHRNFLSDVGWSTFRILAGFL